MTVLPVAAPTAGILVAALEDICGLRSGSVNIGWVGADRVRRGG